MPGQILLYRAGRLKYDYGQDRATNADYGNGIHAAFADLASGDLLLIGPGQYDVVNATITASNVRVLANPEGTIFSRAGSSNYTHLLKVTGSNNIILGIHCDGLGAANTGTGFGIWSTGTRNQFIHCGALNTRGTVADNGDGSGIKIDNVSDNVVQEFYGWHNDYNSIWAINTNRLAVKGGRIYHAHDRSVGINATTNLDLITIEGLYCYRDYPMSADATGTAGMVSNVDSGKQISELVVRNNQFIDEDTVSPGISYDTASVGFGAKVVKLQNCKRLLFDGNQIWHGTENGSYDVRSFWFESTAGGNQPCESVVFTNNWLADCFQQSLKLPHLICENNAFGMRQLSQDYVWYYLACEYARFANNHFNMRNGNCFYTDSGMAVTDYYEFENNLFDCNHAGTSYVFQQNNNFNLTTMAGRFMFDKSNRIINRGAGSAYRSNNVSVNQVLTTDKNADLIWDSSNAGAGAGQVPTVTTAPYFTGITAPAADGVRILAKHWNPAGSGVAAIREFMANGGAWVKYP